jgi:hypothetical protein
MGLQQDMEVGKRKVPGEKIWGPIIGTRQCPRLQKNASKPIMELAQDIKKKKNLEVHTAPKKGIPPSNSFEVFKDKSLIAMAHCFGVEIEENSDSDNESVDFTISSCLDKVTVFPLNSSPATSSCPILASDFVNVVRTTEEMHDGQSSSAAPTASSFCSNSPQTPSCTSDFEHEMDSGRIWTKVCRRRRGKHPKKIVFQ